MDDNTKVGIGEFHYINNDPEARNPQKQIILRGDEGVSLYKNTTTIVPVKLTEKPSPWIHVSPIDQEPNWSPNIPPVTSVFAPYHISWKHIASKRVKEYKLWESFWYSSWTWIKRIIPIGLLVWLLLMLFWWWFLWLFFLTSTTSSPSTYTQSAVHTSLTTPIDSGTTVTTPVDFTGSPVIHQTKKNRPRHTVNTSAVDATGTLDPTIPVCTDGYRWNGTICVSIDYRALLQDVNLRNTPWVQWSIVQIIQKGEQVSILGSKIVNGATWYSVEYVWKQGWINDVAFTSRPTDTPPEIQDNSDLSTTTNTTSSNTVTNISPTALNQTPKSSTLLPYPSQTSSRSTKQFDCGQWWEYEDYMKGCLCNTGYGKGTDGKCYQ